MDGRTTRDDTQLDVPVASARATLWRHTQAAAGTPTPTMAPPHGGLQAHKLQNSAQQHAWQGPCGLATRLPTNKVDPTLITLLAATP